jgi:hypothetical protein
MKQLHHSDDGFSDFDEVEMAYALDQVEVHSESSCFRDLKTTRVTNARDVHLDTQWACCSPSCLQVQFVTKSWIKAA